MDKNKLIVLILVGILSLLYSCSNKDNPVIPQEKPYPSGIPDWNSSEFDWIDSSYIHWWECPKSPKYAISILDCSPDGNNLIVQDLSNNKINVFNQNMKHFEFILNGLSMSADWSKSGKLIGFGFETTDNNNKYGVYNWENNNFSYIIPPNSFDWYSGTFQWWDTDSTFLTDFMKNSDPMSYPYIVNIYTPIKIQKREDLNYNFEQYKNQRYTFNVDSIDKFNCILEIKNDNNIIISSYRIPGLSSAQVTSLKISPDGKYLAFVGSADLTGTKRYDLFMQNGMGGNLVILKLDELNSGNLIFRFFPDFNNHYHGKFYSQYINIGAWSSDSKYFYHTYYLADSTIQIVKRNIYTGNVEFMTDLKAAP